jgi:AcrR family transcriptional regulator
VPGKSKKTGRPAELDRGALLDAAENLFAEKGFEGTTTREVVKKAKCNLALISYYFGGKDGLYKAVLLRHIDRIQLNYSAATFSETALASQWPELKSSHQRKFCAALFELSKKVASDSPMKKIMVREMLTGAVKMTAALKSSEGGGYRFLSALIVEMQKDGKIRKDIDLRYSVLCLIGPTIYSCAAIPMLNEIYGFDKLDESYVRGLCLHQTRVFFEGCAA